ncbi:MAG: tetratricopeptide repeat protein [bacterium]|nr:tetratricopeptide repeat protein [bacterium]
MKERSAWILLVLLFLAMATPAAAEWPDWLERWLFNPRERTDHGLEALDDGEIEQSVEPFEAALRLAGEDPVAQFNAGTGRLIAGRGEAQGLLEAASERGGRELAPRARYNLGNARMLAGDLRGAIEAFKQALRLDPGFQDAKFNLELAQRLLEEQLPEPEPQDPEQDDQEQQQDEEDQQQQEQQQQEREFRDIEDMTAEEAAAILEAVENLEREQRRLAAEAAAKENAGAEKDW